MLTLIVIYEVELVAIGGIWELQRLVILQVLVLAIERHDVLDDVINFLVLAYLDIHTPRGVEEINSALKVVVAPWIRPGKNYIVLSGVLHRFGEHRVHDEI